MQRRTKHKRHFDNRHSRWVARLKVLLPLFALAILSTLFLVADRRGGGTTLQFADPADLDRLLTEGRVANPSYSGMGEGGVSVSFTADEARPEGHDAQADRLLGVWTSPDGAEISLEGDTGILTGLSGDMRVEGDVIVNDAQGYRLRTDALDIDGGSKDIVAPGPVSGSGPGLQLDAGGMRIEQREGSPLVTFTEGVRVVYETKPAEGN